MKKQIVYRAALYLRVSKEDRASFRNSIENQKQFLLDYLKRMPDIWIYDFYIEIKIVSLIQNLIPVVVLEEKLDVLEKKLTV